MDDELNSIETGHNFAVDVAVPGLLAYLSLAEDDLLVVRRSPANQAVVAFGAIDDSVYVVDTAAQTLLCSFPRCHANTVNCLEFSKDASVLFSGGLDGVVCAFDLGQAKEVSRISGPCTIEWMLRHKRGDYLVCGSEDGLCYMLDFQQNVREPSLMFCLSGHEGPVTCGTFYRGDKMLLTGSADECVRLYDLASTNCVSKVHLPAPVTFVHVLPKRAGDASGKGSTVAVGCEDGTFVLLAVHGDALRTVHKTTEHSDSLEFAEVVQARFVVVGSTDGSVSIYDAETSYTLRYKVVIGTACTVAAALPNTTTVIVGTTNGVAAFVDVLTGEVTHSIDVFRMNSALEGGADSVRKPVLGLEPVQEGRAVAVAGDRCCIVWSTDKAQLEESLAADSDGGGSESESSLADGEDPFERIKA